MPKKPDFREKFFFQFRASIHPWHSLPFSANLSSFPLDISSLFRRHPARSLGILLGAVVIIIMVWKWPDLRPLGQQSEAVSHSPAHLRPPADPLSGEVILKEYAKPSSRPEDDLSSLAHAFSNLFLLIKGDSPFRLGANGEFAAALRGKNRDQLRFLPDIHPCFNSRGQLIDRWNTPLFFHVNDRTRIDLRSAGPDRQMWTEDDLHRRYDGQFHRGKDLPTGPSGRNP